MYILQGLLYLMWGRIDVYSPWFGILNVRVNRCIILLYIFNFIYIMPGLVSCPWNCCCIYINISYYLVLLLSCSLILLLSCSFIVLFSFCLVFLFSCSPFVLFFLLSCSLFVFIIFAWTLQHLKSIADGIHTVIVDIILQSLVALLHTCTDILRLVWRSVLIFYVIALAPFTTWTYCWRIHPPFIHERRRPHSPRRLKKNTIIHFHVLYTNQSSPEILINFVVDGRLLSFLFNDLLFVDDGEDMRSARPYCMLRIYCKFYFIP